MAGEMMLDQLLTAYVEMIDNDELRNRFYANPQFDYSSSPELLQRDIWILFARTSKFDEGSRHLMYIIEFNKMAERKGVGVNEIIDAIGKVFDVGAGG
jgi:hypothetical protein